MTGAAVRERCPPGGAPMPTLLAVGEAEDRSNALLTFAGRVARQLGFSLSFVESYEEPPAQIADGYAIGAAAIADVLHRRDELVDQMTASARDCFAALVADGALSAQWAVFPAADVPLEVVHRARKADLVFLSRTGRRPKQALQLIDTVLLTCATPVVVIPEAVPEGWRSQTILCAWDGSSQAYRALLGCTPLLGKGCRIHIVQVGAMTPGGTIEALFDKALSGFEDRGIAVHRLCVARSDGGIAATLLEQCRRLGADLLAMGAYRHLRAREIILGGVTRSIVRTCAVPVLLAH